MLTLRIVVKTMIMIAIMIKTIKMTIIIILLPLLQKLEPRRALKEEERQKTWRKSDVEKSCFADWVLNAKKL